MAIPYLTDEPLLDDYDEAIHQRASGVTLTLFGWLSAIVFPSFIVLSATPYFKWGPWTTILRNITGTIYITYALLVGYYRWRLN
ncbi:hypothetical protein SAMN05216564_10713 [Halopenitus persicus]|uniref:Uncharacterized protein n=1 Tax=Halopenitus persicus TaxID=1048396 RepID=A0A1H3LAQ7_9EURY|nr:hypothetical protein SAMN05216564_10713 [Halopenitus persicus]